MFDCIQSQGRPCPNNNIADLGEDAVTAASVPRPQLLLNVHPGRDNVYPQHIQSQEFDVHPKSIQSPENPCQESKKVRPRARTVNGV